MGQRRIASLGALASVLIAASAHAGTLTSASWETEWRAAYGPIVSFSVPVTASGTSTATSVSVSVAVQAFSSSVSLPGVPLQSPSATLTLDGAQLITATAGMAAATTGIPGAHITRVPMGTVFSVPLRVGVPGTFVTSSAVFFPGIVHNITAAFYAWTVGTLTLTGLTSNLAPLPDLVTMGSFNLTPNGGGTVLLVAPTRITDQSALPYKTAVSLSRLKLHFVPEPGTLLLLGAGVVALGIARRRYGKTT